MILSVKITGVNKVAGVSYYGKLNLVDLAGSERLAKSNVLSTTHCSIQFSRKPTCLIKRKV